MNLLKDKKFIVFVVFVILFTAIYYVAANKISYAFTTDYDINKAFTTTIETIKKCAVAYGKQNLDMFKEEKIIYIKVQDLIDNNFLVPDEKGNIVNPLKNNETLNSNVIKLKYENEEILVEVDS